MQRAAVYRGVPGRGGAKEMTVSCCHREDVCWPMDLQNQSLDMFTKPTFLMEELHGPQKRRIRHGPSVSRPAKNKLGNGRFKQWPGAWQLPCAISAVQLVGLLATMSEQSKRSHALAKPGERITTVLDRLPYQIKTSQLFLRRIPLAVIPCIFGSSFSQAPC